MLACPAGRARTLRSRPATNCIQVHRLNLSTCSRKPGNMTTKQLTAGRPHISLVGLCFAEPSGKKLVAWTGWSNPTRITRGSGCLESAPGLLLPMRVTSHRSVREPDNARQFTVLFAGQLARIYSISSVGNAVKTRRSRFNARTCAA